MGLFHYAPYLVDEKATYLIILISAIEFIVSITVLKTIEIKNKIGTLKGGA